MLLAIRISTVSAVLCAITLLGLTTREWNSRDPRIAQILKQPTAIEQFVQAADRGPRDESASNAPLMVQAKALALYLDPPASEKTLAVKELRTARSAAPVGPATPTVPFQVRGISCYPAEPERSMALIWEPGGNGGSRRWVREGTQIGQYTIHEIRAGSILYRKGGQLCEIPVERQTASRNLVQRQTASVVRADDTSLRGGLAADSNAVAK